MNVAEKPRTPRGLGSPKMSLKRKREIQSMGGKASHGGGRKSTS